MNGYVTNWQVVSIPAPNTKVYQGWSPCMDWCKANCRDFWRYDTEGVFLFKEPADATAFLLRWS